MSSIKIIIIIITITGFCVSGESNSIDYNITGSTEILTLPSSPYSSSSNDSKGSCCGVKPSLKQLKSMSTLDGKIYKAK